VTHPQTATYKSIRGFVEAPPLCVFVSGSSELAPPVAVPEPPIFDELAGELLTDASDAFHSSIGSQLLQPCRDWLAKYATVEVRAGLQHRGFGLTKEDFVHCHGACAKHAAAQ
jgi:hypothetical protein